MNKIVRLFDLCKRSDSNFFIVLIKYLWYLLKNKKILAHEHVKIIGVNNIHTEGRLFIGINNNDFTLPSDKTYLHVKGNLNVTADFHIGRGCRLAVGNNAQVIFGRSMVNANTLFVINHGLTIGDHCVISWNCQFLDDDFHNITYENQTTKDKAIVIGDHVWIGSNVSILKGVSIPNNCVVAANSVVTSSFFEPDCLLAGNPAKIIKKNIAWH